MPSLNPNKPYENPAPGEVAYRCRGVLPVLSLTPTFAPACKSFRAKPTQPLLACSNTSTPHVLTEFSTIPAIYTLIGHCVQTSPPHGLADTYQRYEWVSAAFSRTFQITKIWTRHRLLSLRTGNMSAVQRVFTRQEMAQQHQDPPTGFTCMGPRLENLIHIAAHAGKSCQLHSCTYESNL